MINPNYFGPPNDFDWEVVLDRGTQSSDPSWGMLDDDSTAIVPTTIILIQEEGIY